MDIVNKEIVIETNECVICLNNLDKDDKSIITVKCCNNQFHIKCYLACMNEKQICPLCRTSYIPLQNPQNNQQNNSQNNNQQNPETILNISINDERHNELQLIRRRYLLCVIISSTIIPLFYLFNNYRQMI